MTAHCDVGVLLPTREGIMSGRPDTGPLLAMAENAEAAGFDSIWIGDSITARPRHEPLTLLAAVAARTRRVRLGTAVLLPALRSPVVLAHVVGTLDRVAEGRLILGVGIAGDTPAIRGEFAAVGVPFERRVGRFLEALEICRALWTRDDVAFAGKHFTLEHATVEPKPTRAGGPPIWIGGSGPTALREAARFDAWFPTGPSVEFFAEHFPAVQAAAAAAGRGRDAVMGAAYVTVALEPDATSAERRLNGFLETYYAAPPRVIRERQACYAGSVEGCVEWIDRWVDAGARHLCVRFAGGDQRAQMDAIAARVLPRLHRR
jgi:probable F420-dependent oxidoreductase